MYETCVLIGNGAVGKMTVGQELMKLTGLRLFHNHMTIEPVIEVFGYYNGTVVSQMREIIFKEFAKSDNYGMMKSIVWKAMTVKSLLRIISKSITVIFLRKRLRL